MIVDADAGSTKSVTHVGGIAQAAPSKQFLPHECWSDGAPGGGRWRRATKRRARRGAAAVDEADEEPGMVSPEREKRKRRGIREHSALLCSTEAGWR
jgi:hypothetical protein